MKTGNPAGYVAGLLAALLAAAAIPALAHHSAAAYDQSKSIEITGVISGLQWRNPHVIVTLDVVADDGSSESWPLETAGIQQLVRDGWNRETLAEGTPITATINPMKRDRPGGLILGMTLSDGTTLAGSEGAIRETEEAQAAADRTPVPGAPLESTVANPVHVTEADMSLSLSERAAKSRADFERRRTEWNRLEAEIRPDVLPVPDKEQQSAFHPENQARHAGKAVFDFTGVWLHRSSREQSEERGGKPWHFLPTPPLTAKARASQADTMARRADGDPTADPAALCYPHGLPRSMTRAGNMMIIQEPTAVFTVHRLNNDYRSIFIDGRDHVDPAVRTQSYNGDSIGVWEEDALYIESVGFGSAQHFINPGVPIGPKGRIEERWYLVNDDNTLVVEYRMTDPDHWQGEWIDFKLWDRNLGGDIREGNCILAEDGVLAGLAGGLPGAESEESANENSASAGAGLLPVIGGTTGGFVLAAMIFGLRRRR